MRYRRVREVVDASGKAPVSKWINANLDKAELAALHSRMDRIEKEQIVNPNWLKPYKSLKMVEIRLDHKQRAIRILCEEIGDQIIMLEATQKNGNIDKRCEQRAVRIRSGYYEGKLDVRDYQLPQRI